MLERFRPKVIEEDIGHVNLTDLNHTHGDDTDQNESGFVGIQLQKARQKPNGKETNNRPEEDFEEAEDIPLRDDPILKHEGPYLNQSPLQSQ
jgi:hypothetical protein